MSQEYFENLVERQIREARERGDFDNLPGAGKPLPGLDGPNDPDWWVKGYLRRENLDLSAALPTPLALRKEAAAFPQSLLDVRTEAQVREILEDFNQRVKMDRLRPAVGDLPPLLARTVDVDELVEQWRTLTAQASPQAERELPPQVAEAPTRPRRRWLAWRRHR